jgi:hypothetical protein
MKTKQRKTNTRTDPALLQRVAKVKAHTRSVQVKAEPPVTLTIEKNVPFETATKFRSLYSRTMDKMEVGDSILVPHNKRAGLFNLASMHEWKIKTRTVDAKHIRVWMMDKQDA